MHECSAYVADPSLAYCSEPVNHPILQNIQMILLPPQTVASNLHLVPVAS